MDVRSLSLLAMLTLTSGSAHTADVAVTPIELGRVRWERNHDAALAKAKVTNKPVFVLFQEVPGCMTCTQFGKEVLCHPLLVEAIETEFVPLVIRNNVPGEEKKLLERYKEPSGNNPVVRFLDGNGKDVIPRRDGIWTASGMAQRMIEALEASNRTVPSFLRLTALETDTAHHAKISFAMRCYYEGEARLGALNGVLTTMAGMIGRNEVVEVTYDPRIIKLPLLISKAKELDCLNAVYVHGEREYPLVENLVGEKARLRPVTARYAPYKEQKVSLYHSILGYLPLTPMQATKINASLAQETEVLTWLSPRQKWLLTRMQAACRIDPAGLAGLRNPEEIPLLEQYQLTLELRLMEILDRRSSPRAEGPPKKP